MASLLFTQGRLKITNLFFARVQEGFALQDAGGEELTRMGETMGSVEFLAPEQAISAASVDARSDIYGLRTPDLSGN